MTLIQRSGMEARLLSAACVLVVTFSFATASLADSKIRLLGGVGRSNTDYDLPNIDSKSYHYIFQSLLYVPGDRFRRGPGLEVGKHRVFNSDAGTLEFTSVGIFVEANFLGWLVTQIGTVGYIGNGDVNDQKPFGLRSAIGIERRIHGAFSLSGFLRQDRIFDDTNVSNLSVDIGVGLSF